MKSSAQFGLLDGRSLNRWVDYCRQVVTDSEHRAMCSERGGSDPSSFPSDVRWPGYLGPGYRAGGMLVVANIHRNFDSAGLSERFASDAADAVRRWRDGGDDKTFLEEIAAVYAVGLAKWVVGTNTGRPMRRLNIPISDIAYLNGARCQATDTGTRLQRLCQQRWPLRQIVDILRPELVIVSSSTVLDAAADSAWPLGCTVIGIHQLHGAKLLPKSPWQPPQGGLSFAEWSRYLPQLWAGAASSPPPLKPTG